MESSSGTDPHRPTEPTHRQDPNRSSQIARIDFGILHERSSIAADERTRLPNFADGLLSFQVEAGWKRAECRDRSAQVAC